MLSRDPVDLQLVLNHVESPDGLPIAYVLGVRMVLATLDAVRWACEQGLATVDLGIDADYKARFTRELQRAEGLELTQGPISFVKRLRPPP